MHDTVILQEDTARKTAYELTVRTHRMYRLIYFCLGFIETLLGIRFFFKLFGANPSSWFVSFLYGLSNVLLFPFSGVFQRTATPPGTTTSKIFEPSTVVACIIYVLIAWGLSRLLLIVRSTPTEAKE